MANDWNNVKPVGCKPWLVLPAVYSDALSYGDQIAHFCAALNKLIQNNNTLPEYIQQMIQDYINGDVIGEVVQNIVSQFILNVKYPPDNLKPAVGDGSADDTEAIQGCINYAKNHNGMAVYIPSGAYSVQSLTLPGDVSLFGFDRYTTKLVLRGGATTPMISSAGTGFSIVGLTLDANAGIQVENINVISLISQDVLLRDLIVQNGYNLLVYDGTGGHLQMDNIVFGNTVYRCVNISGNSIVQAKNLKFTQLSAVSGIDVINISSDGGMYDFISNITCETCLSVSGNDNYFSGIVSGATTPYADSGLRNTINFRGFGKKEYYSDNIDTTVEGDAGFNTKGAYSENISGAFTSVRNGTENKIVNGASIEQYNSTQTETVTDKKTINAQDIYLNPSNPLQYKTPEKFNKYFNSIKFKDNNNTYDVLVDNGTNKLINDLDNVVLGNYYGWFFSPYCNQPNYYPQGFCLIDDNTAIFAYALATDNTTIYQKVNLENGLIISTSQKLTAFHANSLTYDGSDNIYSVNFYENQTNGISNVITIIDSNTLTIKSTIEPNIPGGIRSASFYNGNLIIQNSDTISSFYEYDLANSTISKLFTLPFILRQNSYVDSNGNIWVIPSAGGIIYVFNMNGTLIKSINLGMYSADKSVVNVEYEGISELSDGTIIIADVGYKRTSTGRYNRHILSTLNKQLNLNASSNPQLRWDNSGQDVYISNSYYTYQNGSSYASYDSIDYAGKIATLTNSLTNFILNNETIDQYAILSNGLFFFNSGTLGGIVIDVNAKVVCVTININGSCAKQIQAEMGTTYPACIYVRRLSTLKFSGNEINGNNIDNIVGIDIGYENDVAVSDDLITNCSIPMYMSGASNNTVYGGNQIVTGVIPKLQAYRQEHNINYKYRAVGSSYGRRTISLENTTLANITQVNFIDQAINTPMLSIIINSKCYVFDYDLSGNICFTILDNNGIHIINMTIKTSISDLVAYLNFSDISGKTISNTGEVSDTVLDNFTVSKIRIF